MRTIDGIVIHRCEMAFDGFEANKKELPNSYHFFIRKDGTVDAMIKPEVVAYHALSFNKTTIGIAIYGCFVPEMKSRNMHPTEEQWNSAVDLVAKLRSLYGDLYIKGHTELGPKGTKDPKKLLPSMACPGRNWDMDKFRLDVAAYEHEHAGK